MICTWLHLSGGDCAQFWMSLWYSIAGLVLGGIFGLLIGAYFNKAADVESKRLAVSLTLWFVGGTIAIICSHLPLLVSTPLGEVIRDVGIALWIAVLIAKIIELHLAEHTFRRGLDFIMHQTVPEDVWEEFRQHVITQQTMRKNWAVDMKIQEPQRGLYVAHTTVTYCLVALNDRTAPHVRHSLDAHRAPPATPCRYEYVKIGNEVLADTASIMSANLLSNGNLKIERTIRLAKRGDECEVEYRFSERINCPDTIAWWMSKVTQNAKIKISTVGPLQVDVITYHPAENQLKPTGTDEWAFTGIMFPGQGLEIRVTEKVSTAPIRSQVGGADKPA